VPDQPEDNLAPPVKIMRKRLNGVYRADAGFSGPTRRYVLIVALLVGMASVPTLAAITAGTNELADGKTDTMDIPVLPPVSPGPIRTGVGSPSGSPQALPPSGLPPNSPFVRPKPSVPPSGVKADKTRSGRARDKQSSGWHKIPKSSTPAPRRLDRHVPSPAKATGHATGGDGRAERAPRKTGGGSKASWKPTRDSLEDIAGLPAVPAEPEEPAIRPIRTDEDPCRNRRSEDRGRDSENRGGHSGERGGHSGEEDSGRRRARGKGRHEAQPHRIKQVIRSIVSDRSTGRSEQRRRSSVAERPHNARPASILERGYANNGYHGRRLIPGARTEGNQIANHSYRGSHRAGSMHHADDHTPAQRRSSRVGRHHAEPTEDLSGRW
jgi:hypothetical protein